MNKTTTTLGGILAAAVLLVLVPFLVPGNLYIVAFGFQLMVWIVLATSWNVFSGAAGYPSFGHGVFFGIGIYTTAVLLRAFPGLPFVVTILVSGLVSAAVAAALGAAMFASSRFRSDLFGLVTLALAFVVPTIALNIPAIDGGAGVSLLQAAEGTFVGNDPVRLYLTAVVLALLTVALTVVIWRGRWGRALSGIRDDEQVAESLGVPTYRYKVGTFALSAGLAGLIGAPQAVFLGYVDVAAVFSFTVPLFVVMMSILGGVTKWYGPILGAVVIVVLQEILRGLGVPEIAQIVVGLLLVLFIVVLPRGVGGLFESRRRKGPVVS